VQYFRVCIQKRKVFASNLLLIIFFENFTQLPEMELRKSINNIRKVIWCSCYGTKIREIIQSGKKRFTKERSVVVWTDFFIKTTCVHSKTKSFRIKFALQKFNPKNMRAAYLIQLNDVYIICDDFFFLLQLVLSNSYNTINHVKCYTWNYEDFNSRSWTVPFWLEICLNFGKIQLGNNLL
jgi:hypothetical protein